MAFDEKLAQRIRKRLGRRRGLAEKQMFGGLAFLLNGNLCCGVHGRELIVRIAPAETDQALSRLHAHIFDLPGRPMKGWILVRPAGLTTDAALAKWIQRGLNYVTTLPAK